jgi:TIGR03009 family protein
MRYSLSAGLVSAAFALVVWGAAAYAIAQQPGPGQPVPGQPVPVAPAAPFQLTAEQQQRLDEVLKAWAQHSSGITTFDCKFRRWEYNPAIGPRQANPAAGPNGPPGRLMATRIAVGKLKFVQPDKGTFEVEEILVWDPQQQKHVVDSRIPGELWTSDGENVYQVDHIRKVVEKTPIPANMRGKHISEGPLPFLLFGASTEQLNQRYFLSERTAPRYANEEFWIEAYPRWRSDAANYSKARMIMKRSNFLPFALQLDAPNGSDYAVFEFTDVRINNIFGGRSVGPPTVPRGYQLVERQTDAGPPPAGPPAAGLPPQPNGPRTR